MRYLPIFALFVWMFVWIGCDQPAAPPDAPGVAPEVPIDVPVFTEITQSAGLGGFSHTHGGFGEMWMPEIMGSGGGFIDYNNDHQPDILLVGGGALPGRPAIDHPAVMLFENLGAGNFRDVTAATGLSEVRVYGHGIAAADYDGDGDEDFLLTTLTENLLFQNNGGVFTEKAAAAGLRRNPAWSTSALFFDPDRDGDLDLYIAAYLQWTPEIDQPCIDGGKRDYCNPRTYRGAGDQYFRNNGDGTFTDATVAAGFNDSAGLRASKGLGVATLDYNRDGWPDLYVANDGEANFLFKNLGNGTFEEIGAISGVALDQNGTPRAGMGVDTGVVDSTGKTTLVVGNFSAEMVGVWQYDADDFFTDRASRSRIGFPTLNTLSFGLRLFDVDLDTDLDLMMANGHVMKYIADRQHGVTFEQPPQLFLNTGGGIFAEAPAAGSPLLQRALVGRGLATADIDQDGDLDVLITENNGPAHLWRNDLADGRSLRVRLQTGSGAGIGARIRVTVGDLVMERTIRTGSSYLSQSETVATFGLGTGTQVDVLEVIWPDTTTDRFTDIAGSQEILITRGNSEIEQLFAY